MLVIVILVLIVLGLIGYGICLHRKTGDDNCLYISVLFPFVFVVCSTMICCEAPTSINESDYIKAQGAKIILESVEVIDKTNICVINNSIETIHNYNRKREIIAAKSKSIWICVLYDIDELDKYPEIDIPDIYLTKEKDQN